MTDYLVPMFTAVGATVIIANAAVIRDVAADTVSVGTPARQRARKDNATLNGKT